jgi:hypothetical protein
MKEVKPESINQSISQISRQPVSTGRRLVAGHVLRKTYIRAEDNEAVVRAWGLASVDNKNIYSN